MVKHFAERIVAIISFGIALIVLGTLVGCATQVTPVTADDISISDDTPAYADTPAADYTYIPGDEVELGRGTSTVPNDEVTLEGEVVSQDDQHIEIRLLDDRRVRVSTLTDGSVAWHVVGRSGVLSGEWQAPENSILEYSRGVGGGGVFLSLPAAAADGLTRDIAASR